MTLINGINTENINKINDVLLSNISTINSVEISEDEEVDWYFQWTGDEYDNTAEATLNNSTGSIVGSTTGGAIITSASNHTPGGTYSFYVPGSSGRHITWYPLSELSTDEGRLEVWVYVNNYNDDNSIFEIVDDDENYDSNNVIKSLIDHDFYPGQIYFRHEGNNSTVTLWTDNTVPTGSWTRLCYRWSVTNNKIGVKIGDNDWEDDSDGDSVTSMTSVKTRLIIGDGVHVVGSPDVYYDDVTLYNTYDEDWIGE